ncbi:unnamed protein product [Lactuca virosa]|uniref:Uncharacterized protein n=1 Tax=Lactuca virosa TaxID=75947 RepID=A0AAU9NH86_9ASTR|nr:unnamed protein product [Lactuca virosa]
MRVEPITSNELLGLLLQEEQRIHDSCTDSLLPSANFAAKNVSDYSHILSPYQTTIGDHPRLVCQICTKPYHEARNCHQRLNLTAFPATNRKAADRHRQSQSSAKQAFTAYTTSPSALTDPWVVDSGATHHVTADFENLNLQSEYKGADNLTVGNGNIYRESNLGLTDSTPIHISLSSLCCNIISANSTNNISSS